MINNRRTVTLYHTDRGIHYQNILPVWEYIKESTKNMGIEFREIGGGPDLASDFYPVIRMVDEMGHTHQYTGRPDYARLRNWIIAPAVKY